MTRKTIMNMLVSAAAAAASSTVMPAELQASDQALVAVADLAMSGEAAKPQARPEIGEYPPEIFGKLPDGFVLEKQSIEMLCFWHRKAIEVVNAMQEHFDHAPPSEAAWEEFTAYCEIKNNILAAILSAHAVRPGQVAAQLRAVVAEADHLSSPTCKVSIEEILQVDDIVKMSAELTGATAPIVPKKRVGALQRGRKLTRAGLLTRYQSFLVQELETVSWNLYGERDYAKHTIFFDRAVRDRCDSAGHSGPFFDERNLSKRAHAVLKSLMIDTEIIDA
jgi:hypothetical protein